jgi:acetolactate synthase-1/2/3 large subunit
VDIDAEEVGKNYPVDIGIVGDAKAVVGQLLEETRARGVGGAGGASQRVQEIARVKKEWDLQVEGNSGLDNGPVTRLKLFRALKEVFPRETIFLTDEGHVDFPLYFQATRPCYFSGDWRTIGFGFPMAIGLKLVCPSKPVVAICGDGAFSISLQELTTMRCQGATPIIVVLNNSGYAGLRSRLVQFYGNTLGTDFTLPDLKELAKVFDLHGERVQKASELKAVLSRCLEIGKGCLVDVQINES